ncbi:MAG: hypothetical protein HS115_16510 [Spirochaetales bacterium]|nr:hypothetical protein [Spirochaetales bacterium]
MKRITTHLREAALMLKAEFVRDLIFMRRYPLEPLSFIFFMYMILIAVLFGFEQLMQGQTTGLNREKMILGYCLMQFVLSAQMGWSGQIQNESQTGTLEQLSISGHSLGDVLLARGISQFPRHALSFLALFGAYALSLADLNFHLHRIHWLLLLLFITAFGVFGVAYVFAGVTLIFKRVGFFFQIINFAFLGLFWQDPARLEGLTLHFYQIFPLTAGMAAMESLLIVDRIPSIGPMLTFSLLFWLAGYIVFRLLENRARKQGLLSQY